MLLPSHEHGPQASPHLLRADDDGAASRRPDRLHPWVVPTATLGAADAVEFLLGIPGGDEPGLAIGDSPRFLAEISKLGLELLARGRVLPTLARGEDRWVARWKPVATDPADAKRLQLLAESMPPLLRAEVGMSEHSRTPEKIVDGALGAFVDACARRFLTDPLLPPVASRRAPSSVEAWIAALTAADPVVAEEGLGLAALSEQLDAWRDALEHYAAHRTFRTCFRPVRARGTRLIGRRGALARRDPAAGEGRPERTRPGAGRVELERRWPAGSRPPDRGPTGAAAGRARTRAAPVARPRAGPARGRADRRRARHRRRFPVPARRGSRTRAGRLRRAIAGVVGQAAAAQADS